jgi:Tol biopolymer transport system component
MKKTDGQIVLVNNTTWENAHVVIYVANVDGSGARKITEQVVPEGSGGLNVSTIRWSDDGKLITYMETGPAHCVDKRCSIPEDFASDLVTYSVDVATGKKTLVPTN